MHFRLIGHAIQEALNGQGIALGSTALTIDEIAQGRLVAPFAERYRLASNWEYRVVWSATNEPTEATRQLIEWLVDEAQRSFGAP
jgi:LysR family glycine cleavage system transcriptional activator